MAYKRLYTNSKKQYQEHSGHMAKLLGMKDEGVLSSLLACTVDMERQKIK